MIYLLIGLLVLALLYFAGAGGARIDWTWLRRSAGGLAVAALLAVGGWLLLRGNGGAAFLFLLPVVLPVVLAVWRWRRRFRNSDGGRQPDGRTAWFDMRFDRASGALAVTILQGANAGRRLTDLTRMECLALWRVVAADDPASAQLLESWMDRTWGSDWRGQVENEQVPDTDREKALHILGLRDPADEAAVNEAYRRLISANHPDRGGSSYLAAMINWARNILLDKHR